MAPGPSGIDPHRLHPAPAFAAEDDQGATFVLSFDDDDADADPPTLDVPDRVQPPSFLHPESASLLSPLSASFPPMAYDDGPGPAPGGAATLKNPFNFQTQVISTSPVKSQNVGQRRGHRYKHSSISAQHQFFQEPPPRPPPVLPASLPIPTLKEAWSSMHRPQRLRLYWCLFHTTIALSIFFGASGSLAMTALSHLVFFDVGSAAISLTVDVLGNFPVLRRSTIRHPFGLQRAEVLAGFAMSIFLVFGGFDLVSHSLKHMLESLGTHAPHHPHGPATAPNRALAAAAAASTLVSAYGLRNNSRIRRVMRLPGAANPFHALTLLFSSLLLVLPLVVAVPPPAFVWLDRAICALIAASMFVLGVRLAVAQGLMLLMSYSGQQQPLPKKDGGAGVAAVLREIEADPHVARVDEAQFWQVHYGLGVANLSVRVRGGDDGVVSALRARLARVVQNRLGEGYGRGSNLRWEVTVQMCGDGSW
ncbi:cation efflux family-domain-containing protein [Podospora conica]|nr:cation efflux family-domain-containing protein [Schizothecium conicum]